MKTRRHGQIDFIFPDDGVMLTNATGTPTEDGIEITVSVDASTGRKMTLNGEPMTESLHGIYTLPVKLSAYKTALVARDEESCEELAIDVYYLKKGYKRYQFSLDDNIRFLMNLTKNKDVYKTMFEDPYLALLKKIHDKHGSKFHINIYYETPHFGGFKLSEMTDRYKDEWKANADWLCLSFHANADHPDRPYAHASYEQVYFEAERIHKEILRFAGEEAFSNDVTSVHWGDCSIDGARALRDLGYRAFVSAYEKTESGIDIRMYLNSEECEILGKYGFYYDKEEGVIHYKYNGNIQHISPEEIIKQFDGLLIERPNFLYMDIGLHEQYFYPDYPGIAHQPDYFEKFDACAKWCKEHGYLPMFVNEVLEFDER